MANQTHRRDRNIKHQNVGLIKTMVINSSDERICHAMIVVFVHGGGGGGGTFIPISEVQAKYSQVRDRAWFVRLYGEILPEL